MMIYMRLVINIYKLLINKQVFKSDMKNLCKYFMISTLLIMMSFGQSFRINRLKRRNNYMDAGMRLLATKENTASQISLGDAQNAIYYININVGTPSQNFNMIFDTGSDIAWLPLTGSGSVVTFNSAASSTFNDTSTPGQIQYADNSGVYGTMGSDILKIPNATVTNITVDMPFLWVTQEVSFDVPSFIAGLLGMGSTSIPNFLDLAYEQNQISTPTFTLSINSSNTASYLYYNNLPNQIVNTTSFMPVVGTGYWQVQVRGVLVGGIQMSSVAANIAIVDSGTSYFYINQALYNQIMQNFFLDCTVIQGTPVCPCSTTNKWPVFAFLLDGIQVYINPNQYVGVVSQFQNKCTFNFGTLSTVANQLLLGDIFFQGYNITFDKPNQQVGFSGSIGFLTLVTPLGRNLGQYVMLGLIIMIGLIGIIAFFNMGSQTYNPNQGIQEYQISTFRQSGKFQPFVGKRVVLT